MYEIYQLLYMQLATKRTDTSFFYMEFIAISKLLRQSLVFLVFVDYLKFDTLESGFVHSFGVSFEFHLFK